jgi:DNA-directed RNA polymerase subunit K/omega
MLSYFLRRLSGSLFSLAVVTAWRATQLFQNSAPGL